MIYSTSRIVSLQKFNTQPFVFPSRTRSSRCNRFPLSKLITLLVFHSLLLIVLVVARWHRF